MRMNVFFARGVFAIGLIGTFHRRHKAPTPVTAPEERDPCYSFFLAACFLTAPVRMIQRPTISSAANTGTGTDATKARPSIVGIIT